MYRILIVEDHAAMRESMVALVSSEPGMAVGAVAASRAEARHLMGQGALDLALVDLSLPDGSGLELVADLLRLDAGLPIVIVSGHLSGHYQHLALQAGACAYLDKLEIPGRLLPLLRRLLP